MIPVAVTVVVGALALSGDLIEYYCSSNSVFLGMKLSSSPYCSAVVLLTHIAIGSSILILGVLAFGHLFQEVKSQIEKGNLQLANRRESKKKMNLTDEPLDVKTGKLDLRIHNNEDSFIILREAVVFDEHARYRVSVEPEVRVEAHKSRTTRFLTEDNTSKSLQYYIRGHRSDGTSHEAHYGQGIRMLELAIRYDSDEKKNSGINKRFRVTVNYKAEHDFDLKIQDAD